MYRTRQTNLVVLVCLVDYTTRLHRDYNKRCRDAGLNQPVKLNVASQTFKPEIERFVKGGPLLVINGVISPFKWPNIQLENCLPGHICQNPPFKSTQLQVVNILISVDLIDMKWLLFRRAFLKDPAETFLDTIDPHFRHCQVLKKMSVKQCLGSGLIFNLTCYTSHKNISSPIKMNTGDKIHLGDIPFNIIYITSLVHRDQSPVKKLLW